jgi:hypothetical protein
MLLRNGDAIQGKATPSPDGMGWALQLVFFFFFLEQFFRLSLAKLLGLAVAGFFFSFSFSNVGCKGEGRKERKKERKRERNFRCFSLTGTSVGAGGFFFIIFKLTNAGKFYPGIIFDTRGYQNIRSSIQPWFSSSPPPLPPQKESNTRQITSGSFAHGTWQLLSNWK